VTPVNCVYFACETCKVYVDAGYRWAYWTLEHPGAVQRGKRLSLASVLAAEEYWTPEVDAEWLVGILSRASCFLKCHADHPLLYGEYEEVIGDPDWETQQFLDWRCEDPGEGDVTPRYLAEVKGLDSWREVEEFMATLKLKPWWWGCRGVHQRAKKRFGQMVEWRRSSGQALPWLGQVAPLEAGAASVIPTSWMADTTPINQASF
jgi:hypothetical protein